MKRNFLFSRITFTTDLVNLQKQEQLFKMIDNDESIVWRNDSYKLIKQELLKVGAKNFIVGSMIKFKPESVEKVLLDNKVAEQTIDNKVLAEVQFVIDLETNIIAFEENKTYIPGLSFPERLKSIVETKDSIDYSNFVITPITETHSFFQEVENIKYIKSIAIKLVPSNPHSDDIWDDLDKSFKEDNITEYYEVRKNTNKNEGLKLDSVTNAKFHMAEDGYGKVKVEGIGQSGEKIKISTEDIDKQSNEKISDEPKSIQELITDLQNKLDELKKRTDANK